MYIGQRQICQASPKSEGAARLLQAAADVGNAEDIFVTMLM